MKYRNAASILPSSLLNAIQDYIQGEYLYIPLRDKKEEAAPSAYRSELQKRDAQIYLHHLEGLTNPLLAKNYHLSESSIRRIITAQRRRYKTMKELIQTLLPHWNLQHSEIQQIYHSSWQIGSEYVLKIYEDPVPLRQNLTTLQILSNQQIPVAKIIPTTSGDLSITTSGIHCFLSRRLPGSNLIRMDQEPGLARRMGSIIADLHLAFQALDDAKTVNFRNNSLLAEMQSWIRKTLATDGWQYLPESDFDDITEELATIYPELPVQLIHRDVHFGNFLFDQGRFSGYIDFDLSQRNIRIFDLCYFLLGLLSEEDKLSVTQEQWFDYVRETMNGYEEKCPLTETERHAIPLVMECIELLFVAYFTGQEDTVCAEGAWKLFEFVRANQGRISVLI